MLADQFKAPALLKTGGEGSVDQTGNVEKKVVERYLGIDLKKRLEEKEYKQLSLSMVTTVLI